MILFDTHVHLYDPQTVARLLLNAHANFEVVARGLGNNASTHDGVLCLTQTDKSLSVEQLLDVVNDKTVYPGFLGDWQADVTKEKGSLALRTVSKAGDPRVVFLISGQQIVTMEKLEVLSIANKESIAGGLPLNETISAIAESGGISIIPWGVGKWLGKRGKILKELIEMDSELPLFLGDNLARPKFWFYVPHFNIARKRGIKILNGSDPLSFSSELAKPGCFGVAFPFATLDRQLPAANIKNLLLDRHQVKKNYGSPQSFRKFVATQLTLNLMRFQPNTTARGQL
jgi:hypothetical protein